MCIKHMQLLMEADLAVPFDISLLLHKINPSYLRFLWSLKLNYVIGFHLLLKPVHHYFVSF